ncbi:MAG: pilus assembly protein [Rhodobacteraceae bacterium]|nr:pilus assembly protein [Paracoccaceae bacterium]
MKKTWGTRVRKLSTDETGTVTVELCIWLPFLVGLLGMVFDLSLLMINNADMWNVASDTTRQLAIGALSVNDATTYVNDTSFRGQDYSVTITTAGNMITTEVSIPWDHISVTNWFMDSTAKMTVSVSQRIEPTT